MCLDGREFLRVLRHVASEGVGELGLERFAAFHTFGRETERGSLEPTIARRHSQSVAQPGPSGYPAPRRLGPQEEGSGGCGVSR